MRNLVNYIIPPFYRNISLLVCGVILFAQLGLAQTVTLSGFIRESGTQNKLAGAVIADLANGKGCISDKNGAFSLSSPTGQFRLALSFPQYASDTLDFSLSIDSTIVLELQPAAIEL